MDRSRNSVYENPLTFKVAVTFVFYALTTSLCLSSFSTCICVIFDPVGTFRTIANYLFYALGASVLLTLLLVGLVGVYTDHQSSSESTRGPNGGDDGEGPASHQDLDATLLKETQREVSGLQKNVDAMPTQERNREGSAPQEVIQTLPMPSLPVQTLPMPSLPIQTLPVLSLPIPLLPMVDGPPTTSAASEDCCKKLPIATVKVVGEKLSLGIEISASPAKSNDAAEQNANAPDAETPNVKPASQSEASGNAITTRKSKQIEAWISQTDEGKTLLAPLNRGADGNHHSDTQTNDPKARRRSDGMPLLQTLSLVQESDFQKAMRRYMGTGRRCGGSKQRAAPTTVSTPTDVMGTESEFQGLFRKWVTAEKTGRERMKALSL